MQHRVTKSVQPKLWFRWLNWGQPGKQPSGRKVSFARHHGFTMMDIWRNGRIVKTVVRRH